jgi:dTDP-4-amino-4,6-dideoxygalactose transaminase
MKKVRIFDLSFKDANLIKEYKKEFESFLKKGIFFLGPDVEKLEKNLSNFLKVKHVVCLSSGSSALYLSLKAAGIMKGDEVITSPLSWIITANAIIECGAVPVFADIDENLNICPNSIKRMISKKTKAIVPMHYGGKMCKMNEITNIAKTKKITIIEDAAQSFGSSLNKKMSGTFSKVAAFSLNPMKPLGGLGEGGFCATNNSSLYQKLKKFRYAGTKSNPIKRLISNDIEEPSLNHKMSSLNAIFIIKQLKRFRKEMLKRNKIAEYYLKNINNVVHIHPTKNETNGRYIFTFRTKKRDQMINFLQENNIESKVYHLPLISNIKFYKKYKRDKLVNASNYIHSIISIPCHSKLNMKEVKKVVYYINKFHEKN